MEKDYWDFEELRKLSKEKNIPESTIYQNSLEWRWKRADFHAKKAQEAWTELYKSSFTFGDQRYYEAVFSYEAHVEACIQSLDSMIDILAQIINIVILGSRFSEHQVSPGKIIKYMQSMQNQKNTSYVLDSLKKLLDSGAFCYINAFCNTIKHRRLIKTYIRAEYGDNYKNKSGIKFLEFHYKDATHPETWGDEILERYRYQLKDLLTYTGLNINKFLSGK